MNDSGGLKQGGQVRSRASVCPYCRDDVHAEESVACQGCLSRHHPACWNEGGQCSSCGGSAKLTVERKPLTRQVAVDVLLGRGFSAEEVEGLLTGGDQQGALDSELAGRAITAFVGLVLCSAFAVGAGLLVSTLVQVEGGWTEFQAGMLGGAVGCLAFGVFAVVLLLILRRR
jgi:hypothetical protein